MALLVLRIDVTAEAALYMPSSSAESSYIIYEKSLDWVLIRAP